MGCVVGAKLNGDGTGGNVLLSRFLFFFYKNQRGWADLLGPAERTMESRKWENDAIDAKFCRERESRYSIVLTQLSRQESGPLHVILKINWPVQPQLSAYFN